MIKQWKKASLKQAYLGKKWDQLPSIQKPKKNYKAQVLDNEHQQI